MPLISIRTERTLPSQSGPQAGFSLVELLVVVSIISILGLIAQPNYTKFVDRAKVNAAKATLSQAKAGAVGIREIDDVTLIDLTGQVCSTCTMGAAFNTDPATWGSIANAAPSWARIGFDSVPRDAWGRPFMLEENEQEFGVGDCRYDVFYSAGPDHIWMGWGDGDDVFGDDVIIRVPRKNDRACPHNLWGQFGS